MADPSLDQKLDKKFHYYSLKMAYPSLMEFCRYQYNCDLFAYA